MTTRTATATLPLKTEVLNILGVLESFSKLLTDETLALKKSDFKTMDDLQPKKREIAKTYQDMVTSLSRRQAEMSGLDGDLRERLIMTRMRFTHILQDNMVALENMKRSTQRLVNRILDVARDSVTEETHHKYSANGKMQSTASAGLSLNLDQRL